MVNFYFENTAKYLINGEMLSKAFYSASESFDLVAIMFPDEFKRQQATLSARIIVENAVAEVDNDRIKLVHFEGGYEVVCLPTPLFFPNENGLYFQEEYNLLGKTHLLSVKVGSNSAITIECDDSIFEKNIPPMTDIVATGIEVDNGAMFVIKGSLNDKKTLLAVLYNDDYKEILFEIADTVALTPESIVVTKKLKDMSKHVKITSYTFDTDTYRVSDEEIFAETTTCSDTLLPFFFVENAVLQDRETLRTLTSPELLENIYYFKDFFGDFKYFTTNKFRPLNTKELFFVYDKGNYWVAEAYSFEIINSKVVNVFKN